MRHRLSALITALACVFAVALVVGLAGCRQPRVAGSLVEGNIEPGKGAADEPLLELDSDGSYGQKPAKTVAADYPITALEGQEYPRPEANYTVMVYVVGSDLEDRAGCATLDIFEMINAKFDATRSNVVVYTGGSQSWHSNIPNDRNCVLEIADGRGMVVAATDRALNMGSPDTLSSFVAWASENYPAEHTALVLWDHGSGPDMGYGFDQLYAFDSLSLDEMREAMTDAGYGPEHKLDWVGFDACLMNSLEVLQVWQDFATYFVGSQDVEDGHGWDYSFLSALDGSSEPQDVTRAVVETFGSFYIGNPLLYNEPNATLAAIDLAAVPQLEEALDTLSDAVLDDFEDGNYATIARARELCRGFGSTSGETSGSTVKLIDFVDLAERVSDEHPEQAQGVRAAVDAAVIANATNLTGAHGVSLYFPSINNANPVNPATVDYGRLLDELRLQGQESSQISWEFPHIEQTDQIIAVGLDVIQHRSLASASFTILEDYDGRGLVPLVSNVRITPRADGTLEVPTDPFVFVTSSDHDTVVPVEQVDADPTRQVFRCGNAFLLPGTEFVDAPNGAVNTALSLALDGESGQVSIASAAFVSDAQGPTDGRMTLDLFRYKTLMLSYGGWQYPERDEDGSMLPYAQWDELGGNLSWSEVPIEGDLTFETKRVSELTGTYMLQVVVSDVNGNKHASELIELTSRTDNTATVATEQGTLRFALGKDHATLTGYKGTDQVLEVPAQVEGLPVTEVANDALSGIWDLHELTLPDSITDIGSHALNCYNLEKLTLGSGLITIGNNSLRHCGKLDQLELPEGLRSIGRGSLSSLGVSSLKLPSTLEQIGEGALVRCEKLTAYEVADGCTAAQERDGVLLSADGSTIIAFPAGREGTYKTPEGVTRVGYGAFTSTSLTGITLSEGVTAIDNCAFYSSSFLEIPSLAQIELPDSLESVGSYAFGSTYNGSSFTEAPLIEELHLGPNLNYLGTNAFTGLRIARFDVDADNTTFSSPGGFIANRMGDTLIEAPSGMGQVVVIPEGITTLGKDLFALASPGTDFVLPASTSRISVLAFPYHYEGSGGTDASRVYDIRLHCAEGTPAAEFAERHNVSWDTVTDVDELTATETTLEQGGLKMTFLVYPHHATLHAIDATMVESGLPLVIPQEVEGSPVTSIDGLQQSRGLPTTWKSVTLPATLSSIDQEAIPMLRSDEGFVLDGESETYSASDGVLFSADGRTLVAFALRDPNTFDTTTAFSYEIPEGVRTIGAGAFNQSQLERVTMPASLRVIQKGAFRYNFALTDIQLNEGLERIEARAFSCPATSIKLPSSITYLGDSSLNLDGFDALELPESLKTVGMFVMYDGSETLPCGVETLHIGRKLTKLGQGSLASLDVKAFEVDERNKRYASIDGLLTNKRGTRLVRCPAGLEGELHIPEGIQHLEPGCLEQARGLTDVYFPSSVIGVDGYMSFGADSTASKVTFHCAHDSEAARYAQAHGIAWTED